jgi:protocatechuate 3,4-dioxygenase beta subunit
MKTTHSYDRRGFLARLGMASAFFTTPGAFAQQLVLTPAQTAGPFYPDKLPLDTDNDLLVINDRITPAVGEIWQTDANGAYIHSQSGNAANRDANFQGFGRFLTGSTGEYLFRTVKPVSYPGRTRHVHFSIQPPGGQKLITQLYVDGDTGNAADGVLNGIADAAARASVIVPFAPLDSSRIGELAARFDIVLGFTPAA